MKLKSILSLFCLLALVATALAQSPAPQQQKAESQPPKFELEAYQFGLLRRGSSWTPTTDANKAELEKLQAGHMANIQRMAKLGQLIAAGPMADDGELRGVFIFRTASLAAAKALAADDPMIKAERLKLDLYLWWGPKGIGAKLNEEYRKNPSMPMTMTKYYLALLTKGAKTLPAAASRQLQLAHLWNVRRMLDARTFATAGPFETAGELRGIFVIAAASPEEAKTIAEADPAVKAGQLAVELHAWWVAKEVWP
jgi:uncharacterized protein YciI